MSSVVKKITECLLNFKLSKKLKSGELSLLAATQKYGIQGRSAVLK